jgi:hypothetical protein
MQNDWEKIMALSKGIGGRGDTEQSKGPRKMGEKTGQYRGTRNKMNEPK